jgi:hypothetical protein
MSTINGKRKLTEVDDVVFIDEDVDGDDDTYINEDNRGSKAIFKGKDIYARYYRHLAVNDPLNKDKEENLHLCVCGSKRKQDISKDYSNL